MSAATGLPEAARVAVGAEWSSATVPAYTTPGTWTRFTTKVVTTPRCWFWCGAIADDGYGRLSDHEGRVVRVSRYVLAAHTGPIPAGLVAEHRVCDEPLCTRLSHLRASTQAENLDTARRRDRLGTKWRAGRADRRGMAARSRAIREALRDPAGGYAYRPDQLALAMAGGDNYAGQETLVFDIN